MNSNTFEDQPAQPLSYKFGSLSHTDPGGPSPGGRAQRRVPRAGGEAGGPLAHGVDRRRRELPGSAPHPKGARALPREPARDLPRPARGLSSLHRAQALRAGLLLHRDQRLGRELLLRPRARGAGVLARRPRAPRPQRQHRDDRGPAHPVREAGRLPLQRQQVRGRRPRRRLDQAVPALPDLQRAGRRRARAAAGLRSRLHARPVAQRDRPSRVADDERGRARARLRPGPPRGPRAARRAPGAATTPSSLSRRSSAPSRPTWSRSWPWPATARAARSTRWASTGRAATASGRRRSDRRPGGFGPGSCSDRKPRDVPVQADHPSRDTLAGRGEEPP